MRLRGSKYSAKRTEVDGIVFHSQKEAKRYQELKLLLKGGHIRHLELQPTFDLIVHEMSVGARLKRAAAKIRGRSLDQIGRIKVGTYRADFRYQQRELRDSENEHYRVVVEDVKGFKTPLYKWKKKHVEAQYGIQILET